MDEWVSYRVLLNQDNEIRPDMIIAVADASNLGSETRFSVPDYRFESARVVVLTMMDLAAKGSKSTSPNWSANWAYRLSPSIPANKRGFLAQENYRTGGAAALVAPVRSFIDNQALAVDAVAAVRSRFPELSDYAAIHYLINHESFSLQAGDQEFTKKPKGGNQFNPTKTQAEEIPQRYSRIRQIMQATVSEPDPAPVAADGKIDDPPPPALGLPDSVGGVVFPFFQSVFWLASFPMDWIDGGITYLLRSTLSALPDTRWTDLLVNGILPFEEASSCLFL